MPLDTGTHKNHNKLFKGLYNLLLEELSHLHDAAELMRATDELINIFNGSITKQFLTTPHLRGTYHSRDTFTILNDHPWSICGKVTRDDCDEGFMDHRTPTKLKKYLG